MSYGLRNTLILLLFLLLILGGGFGWIYLTQYPEIEERENSLSEKQEEYDELSLIVEQYPVYEDALERARSWIENFDKGLFPTHDPDQIYRYLTQLNISGPRISVNYQFQDSTSQEQYGIVRSTITGNGSWQGIYNLINRIENSHPVQKVRQIDITPINQPGDYGTANFSIQLESYYSRSVEEESFVDMLAVQLRQPDLFHNPFFPLIRQVEPNEDNLPNVEASRLIGLNRSRAFLRNQNGQVVRLAQGDEVYLGRLTRIDVNRGEAVFRLNKGGLIEEVTLEVRR